MTTEAPERTQRIAGLDVARALALFGMFAAHVGNSGEYAPGGWGWLAVTHGRSSALFAMLAGVSIALMLSHAQHRFPRVPVTGVTDGEQESLTSVTPVTPAPSTLGNLVDTVRHTRIRVAVRGGMLMALGWGLALLATPVDIILDNLGVMFLLALAAFRWRPQVLIVVGLAILACGRAVLVPLTEAMPAWLYDLPVVHELWSIHYPALIWVGYVLVGLGLGRLSPWWGRALGWLAASGLVLAAAAYGTGAALWRGRGPEWASLEPHSYTAFETLGNVGVACAVIASCCWLAHALPRPTWPFGAAGSMTLTLYSAQVVVIAIAGAAIVYDPSNVTWLAMCAVCVAFASWWKWKVGQGPLERVFSAASSSAANADARRRARVSAPG